VRSDRWTSLAHDLRGGLDGLRYLANEYAAAPKLRERGRSMPLAVRSAVALLGGRRRRFLRLLGALPRRLDGALPPDMGVERFLFEPVRGSGLPVGRKRGMRDHAPGVPAHRPNPHPSRSADTINPAHLTNRAPYQRSRGRSSRSPSSPARQNGTSPQRRTRCSDSPWRSGSSMRRPSRLG